MIAFPFFFALARQTHFVIWCYFKLFFIYISLLVHNAYNIRHLMRGDHTHKTPELPHSRFFFSFSVFIQLWRIPLQKKCTYGKKNLFKSFADDLKNREKVKVIFFRLAKIEACGVSLSYSL